ncbi:MAG: biotin/lipoyl-binding protein, partial [Candidatus Dormibacteraeota bacterium]|nr:biotin/lipoyl-binding protein [Candidatus Dormibacteraeota bacterium]
MPKLSDTMEEGTVLDWKVADGQEVHRGDVLAEIESDKASFEIEAEHDGALHIVVAKGQAAPVGEQIATIGEGAPAAAEKPPADEPAEEEAPAGKPAAAEAAA